MRIGIIGAGDIGGTLARLFVRAGHTVSVSNSRGPGSLAALVAELGPNGQARTKDDVLGDADLVILAAHWRQTEALPSPQQVTGKIVIDTMNPYTPDGGQFDLGDSTPSEETARRLPGARLVKAFNTMWWKHLAERGRTDLSVDQRQALFIAGDDASAKRIVAALIEQIGFACVDTGTLKDGGRLQAVGSPLYNSPMTGVQARTAIDALQGASTSRDGAVKAELDRLTREFFKAVSFEAGETPPYENIHALFIEPGLLIKNSASTPEIATVRQFIEPRQAMVRSGELTRFDEAELSEDTMIFGNVAHRFSAYAKSGTLNGVPFEARGMISTQFILTPLGWKMSAMAWDDERPGLSVAEHRSHARRAP